MEWEALTSPRAGSGAGAPESAPSSLCSHPDPAPLTSPWQARYPDEVVADGEGHRCGFTTYRYATASAVAAYQYSYTADYTYSYQTYTVNSAQ